MKTEDEENKIIKKFTESCSLPRTISLAGVILPPLLLVGFSFGIARLIKLKHYESILMKRETESHYTVYAQNDLKDAKKLLELAIFLPVILLVGFVLLTVAILLKN